MNVTIENKKSNSHAKISILLCNIFSGVSTWMGAYKVTDWFSDFGFLDYPFHLLFSFFTAFVICYIINRALTDNLDDIENTEDEKHESSTPYIFSIFIVLGLSFFLSVVGLSHGYRNFYKRDILRSNNIVLEQELDGTLKSLKKAEEIFVYAPIKKVVETLQKKVSSCKDNSAELSSIEEQLNNSYADKELIKQLRYSLSE